MKMVEIRCKFILYSRINWRATHWEKYETKNRIPIQKNIIFDNGNI